MQVFADTLRNALLWRWAITGCCLESRLYKIRPADRGDASSRYLSFNEEPAESDHEQQTTTHLIHANRLCENEGEKPQRNQVRAADDCRNGDACIHWIRKANPAEQIQVTYFCATDTNPSHRCPEVSPI